MITILVLLLIVLGILGVVGAVGSVFLLIFGDLIIGILIIVGIAKLVKLCTKKKK